MCLAPSQENGGAAGRHCCGGKQSAGLAYPPDTDTTAVKADNYQGAIGREVYGPDQFPLCCRKSIGVVKGGTPRSVLDREKASRTIVQSEQGQVACGVQDCCLDEHFKRGSGWSGLRADERATRSDFADLPS